MVPAMLVGWTSGGMKLKLEAGNLEEGGIGGHAGGYQSEGSVSSLDMTD